MTDPTRAFCRQVIAHHSKSFALASRLLPGEIRDDTAALYAWCRRADDAIDLASGDDQLHALSRLRRELDSVYAGHPQSDPTLAAFQAALRQRGIPRDYPAALLDGLRMDVVGVRYVTLDTLLLYCFRVAGVVGLMMCHVMGVSHVRALRHAAHLGIAMQLTNICRDVEEDWLRGRLYLPACLLRADWYALQESRGASRREALARAHASIRRAVRELRALSDAFYRSADIGMAHLPWRAALAVRTARLVYSAIGRRLGNRNDDVLRGRVIVPITEKLGLALLALVQTLLALAKSIGRSFRPADLSAITRSP